MAMSKHILHVLNTFSHDEMEKLKSRYALLGVQGHDVKVSLLYINPSLPSSYLYMPSTADIAEKHDAEAKSVLSRIGHYFGVDKEDHWIANGNIKAQALKLASNIKADCILVSQSLLRALSKPDVFGKQPLIPIETVGSF